MSTPTVPTDVPPTNTNTVPAHVNLLNTIKARANECLSCFDKELSQNQCATEFERRTGVPKTYVALGVASIYFIFVFFNIGAKLLTSLLAFIYPGKYAFI
jgi:receptor expression-enhancing protein 5/6